MQALNALSCDRVVVVVVKVVVKVVVVKVVVVRVVVVAAHSYSSCIIPSHSYRAFI